MKSDLGILGLAAVCVLGAWGVIHFGGEAERAGGLAKEGVGTTHGNHAPGDAIGLPQVVGVLESGAALRSGVVEPAASESVSQMPGTMKPMTHQEILDTCGEYFALLPQQRENLLRMNGSMLKYSDPKKAGKRFRRNLTQEQFDKLVLIEQPFNESLQAAAEMYADEVDYARRDVWTRRAFTFEDRLPNGSYRRPVGRECYIAFPGAALFYSLQDEDYPAMASHLALMDQIKHERHEALRLADV